MNLSSEQYSEMMNLLKHAILATDLSLHIQYAQLQAVTHSLIRCGRII